MYAHTFGFNFWIIWLRLQVFTSGLVDHVASIRSKVF